MYIKMTLIYDTFLFEMPQEESGVFARIMLNAKKIKDVYADQLELESIKNLELSFVPDSKININKEVIVPNNR